MNTLELFTFIELREDTFIGAAATFKCKPDIDIPKRFQSALHFYA